MPCCSFGTKEGQREKQSLPTRRGLRSDGFGEMGKEIQQKACGVKGPLVIQERGWVTLRKEESPAFWNQGDSQGLMCCWSRGSGLHTAPGAGFVLAPEERRKGQVRTEVPLSTVCWLKGAVGQTDGCSVTKKVWVLPDTSRGLKLSDVGLAGTS